jgi:hypothetical protein
MAVGAAMLIVSWFTKPKTTFPATRCPDMTPTVEQLANAVYVIGDEEPLEREIPQEVLDKLAELGMVNLEVDSAPTLTEYGQRTYTAMEAGDDVPEFTYEAEE